MSKTHELLAEIVIPGKYSGDGRELRFPVVPLTDQWLVSSKRTWEEVDGVIEGRLSAIQESAWGGVGTNLARVLSYVELVSECRYSSTVFDWRARHERQTYEVEKEGIKKNASSQGRVRRDIAEVWSKHEPAVRENSSKAEDAGKVEELVLRKAVLELFSAKGSKTEANLPIVVSQFPKLLNEAKEKTKSPKSVEYFIEALADYLHTTRDSALFARYSYRYSADVISSKEDCLVLDTMLGFALDTEAVAVVPEATEELKRLGKSYFIFLKRRALNVGLLQKYPILTMVYDMETVAYYKGKEGVIASTNGLIDRLFKEELGRDILRREVNNFGTVLADKAIGSIDGMAFVHQQVLSQKRLMQNENIKHVDVDIFTSVEPRLVMAWSILEGGVKLGKVDELGGRCVFARDAYKEIALATVKAIAVKVDKNKAFNLFHSFLRLGISVNTMEMYRNAGIELDLAGYVSNLLSSSGKGEEKLPEQLRNNIARFRERVTDGRLGIEDRVQEMVRMANLMKESFSMDALYWSDVLEYYRIGFWGEMVSGNEIEKENEFLWRQVLDNSVWFVSPRGDRFMASRDPQLAEKAIESVTFRVDRRYPREHKLEVGIRGFEKPVELWLDVYKNMLDGSRNVLTLDHKFRQAFTNLILRRLYFITSGLLSNRDERLAVGDQKRQFLVEFRRAHYRYLSSTPGRVITMESQGAQMHAKEIKEKFGIDIYEEIKRRRVLGTLRQDQFLTFVDEVTTGIEGRLVLPNQLVYDPDLVILPI